MFFALQSMRNELTKIMNVHVVLQTIAILQPWTARMRILHIYINHYQIYKLLQTHNVWSVNKVSHTPSVTWPKQERRKPRAKNPSSFATTLHNFKIQANCQLVQQPTSQGYLASVFFIRIRSTYTCSCSHTHTENRLLCPSLSNVRKTHIHLPIQVPSLIEHLH